MPTLEDYEPLAPFSLEELVQAVNAVLRDRPRLHVQARTVRYYISRGLVPPPQGSPRFARYGMEHLRQIVEIRLNLDQGKRLDESTELAEAAAFDPAELEARPPLGRAPRPVPTRASRRAPRMIRTLRLPLTPFITLELPDRPLTADEIEEARVSFDTFCDSLDHTS